MAEHFPDREHWLGGVYVSADFRGHAIGGQLADRIAAKATEFGVTDLYLQTERLDGGLYAGRGWVPLERVRNKNIDVQVMVRKLAAADGN